MNTLYANQCNLIFTFLKLLPKIYFKKIFASENKCCEWLLNPLNYVRMIEIPLALDLLEVRREHSILDIGSPKALGTYLLLQKYQNTVFTDIDYNFLRVFKESLEELNKYPNIFLADAQKTPIRAQCFDRVFSISALEHIAGEGDKMAIKSAIDLLKVGGKAVFTFPACVEYLVEWIPEENFYWSEHSKKRGDNKVFYQHRYSNKAISERFDLDNIKIEKKLFIAEKPLVTPGFDESGKWNHNFHHINSEKLYSFQERACFVENIINLALNLWYSRQLHYLTQDPRDPNIRQVAVSVRRVN